MLFEINETSHRSIMITVDEGEFVRIINATSTYIKVNVRNGKKNYSKKLSRPEMESR